VTDRARARARTPETGEGQSPSIEPGPLAIRASIVWGGAGDPPDPIVLDPDGMGHPGAELDGWRRLDREHAAVPSAGERHLVLLPEPTPDDRAAGRREVVIDGWRFELVVEGAARAALRERARRGLRDAEHDGPTEVRAIIPGVVVSVAVGEGDTVQPGQQLLAIEAMKMQNELRAPRAGTIERVAVGPGRTIEVGDLLVVIG